MGEPVVLGIVVHHDSYDTIGATVRLLGEAGLPATDLLVVDNSEDLGQRAELETALGAVEVLYTENRGYGAAVNAGLRHLRRTRDAIDFLLVATHEVEPERTALKLLVDALVADPRVAAVGPTLLIGAAPHRRIWSCGGSRSDLLHVHTHVIPHAPLEQVRLGDPVDRLWLDGALVLYRTAALPDPPFDERYFMYMEETDLHYRLRAGGWRCLWVPGAVVTQDTNLTPAFYLGRNLKLFFRKNEDPLRALIVPALMVLREAWRRVRARDSRGAWDVVRGLLTPARAIQRSPSSP